MNWGDLTCASDVECVASLQPNSHFQILHFIFCRLGSFETLFSAEATGSYQSDITQPVKFSRCFRSPRVVGFSQDQAADAGSDEG